MNIPLDSLPEPDGVFVRIAMGLKSVAAVWALAYAGYAMVREASYPPVMVTIIHVPYAALPVYVIRVAGRVNARA